LLLVAKRSSHRYRFQMHRNGLHRCSATRRSSMAMFNPPLQRTASTFCRGRIATPLPLRTALQRFSDHPSEVFWLLSGSTGCHADGLRLSATALPISWVVRLVHGKSRSEPTRDPTDTLRNIRQETASVLPGAVVRRQFFFAIRLSGKPGAISQVRFGQRLPGVLRRQRNEGSINCVSGRGGRQSNVAM
jgi:hypothetical protein